ncbi:MAG: TonB family protein [Rhodoferax sp.]|nr:TonB family protein [Rhodoferax sp.]
MASLGVHAVLLTLRLVDPQAFNRVFQDAPLEVVLVNARTQERPARPQAIAQAAMAGGGDAAQGRATSPLTPSALSQAGDDTQETAQQRVRELQQQQELLLAQVRSQLAALPPPDNARAGTSPEEAQREERRRQLVRLLAEIERRIQEENARPKRRYISPATREAVYAVYYDQLRRAIENQGTTHFPQDGARKLYGELTMIVTVNHDGRVLATEVVHSSGNRVLDRRAEAIARSAGPFGTFNAAMRRQADQILVVSRFRFTREQTLETRLSGQ